MRPFQSRGSRHAIYLTRWYPSKLELVAAVHLMLAVDGLNGFVVFFPGDAVAVGGAGAPNMLCEQGPHETQLLWSSIPNLLLLAARVRVVCSL